MSGLFPFTVFGDGTGVVTSAWLNGVEFTTDLVGDLRSFSGVTGMQGTCRGLSYVNDGFGGTFYWANGNSYVDDGINTIVPSGAVQGAWIRLFANQGADAILTFVGGPPTSNQFLGGEAFVRGVSFPANFSGSSGLIPELAPTASFAVTIKKVTAANVITTIGTATCSTGGAWTFTSVGSLAYSFVATDQIKYYGPASPDATMANFGFTLKGAIVS